MRQGMKTELFTHFHRDIICLDVVVAGAKERFKEDHIGEETTSPPSRAYAPRRQETAVMIVLALDSNEWNEEHVR